MTAHRIPLSELEQGIPFEQRHIGPDAEAQAKMLAQVGYGSLDELTAAAVPDVIKSAERAGPARGARTEAEVLAELRALADRNQVLTSMIGLGYYGTITPPVILRNVLENPAWYTAYTPVPAGDLPGPARGAAQLPDDGRRPDRAADLRRLAARRGHRRRRGDGAGPPGRQGQERRLPGRRRRPAADHRGDRRPAPSRLGIEVVVADLDRRHPGRDRRARRLRRAAAVPGRLRRASATCAPVIDAGARARARSSPSPPTCSR